jgi:hypothetical protein
LIHLDRGRDPIVARICLVYSRLEKLAPMHQARLIRPIVPSNTNQSIILTERLTTLASTPACGSNYTKACAEVLMRRSH